MISFLFRKTEVVTEDLRNATRTHLTDSLLSPIGFDFSETPRSGETTWSSAIGFLMRRAEEFLKTTALEVDLTPELTENGRMLKFGTQPQRSSSARLAGPKYVCKPDIGQSYGSYGHSSFYNRPPSGAHMLLCSCQEPPLSPGVVDPSSYCAFGFQTGCNQLHTGRKRGRTSLLQLKYWCSYITEKTVFSSAGIRAEGPKFTRISPQGLLNFYEVIFEQFHSVWHRNFGTVCKLELAQGSDVTKKLNMKSPGK
ncbi:unnamed protein product [Nesidiocoris tenuis]|uniref:Uncharacterized protein n=1 Tax=Nesidiocoris tenuis TaxID=355587 RepID=A0A6H5HNV3_9HEMI|nr:unnamed protein product [Nesidiocoris tenuis]